MARTWCLVFAALLVLPMLLPGGAVASHADEADEDLDEEDIGPTGDFLLGHGSARGTGVSVGPSRSGFNFTTDFAISLADYQNTVARGDSRGVALGMIIEELAATADEDGEFLPLPESLRIDSRDEGAADGVSQEEFGAEESGLGGAVGSQYVRANEDPFSEVETVMGAAGLGPLLRLDGGTSHATAGIVDEGQREARGEAVFSRLELLEGAIELEGLEWTALHRSGVEDEVDATFTVGDIKIMGESVLPDEASEQAADGLAQGIDAVNELTAELGLLLQTPEMAVNDETGEVRMTPLKIAIVPSDLSRELFRSPLGDLIQTLREPLADALIDAEETFGAAFLLFDVALGAFQGGGEIVFEIGGARAVTGAQEFDDPFGDGEDGVGEEFGELPDEPTPSGEPDLDTGEPDLDTGDPDLGDGAPAGGADLDEAPDMGDPSEAPTPETSATPDTSGDEPEDEAVDDPVASEPPEQAAEQSETAQPAAIPGSRGGQALMAALVALLVAAGLGGADFMRLRQSQRTIPT